jgi:hypothetical protein
VGPPFGSVDKIAGIGLCPAVGPPSGSAATRHDCQVGATVIMIASRLYLVICELVIGGKNYLQKDYLQKDSPKGLYRMANDCEVPVTVESYRYRLNNCVLVESPLLISVSELLVTSYEL